MISSIKKVLPAVALLFFASSLVLQAQPHLQAVQEQMEQHISQDNMQGISAAYIYPDGRTQFISKGYVTSQDSGRVTPNTIFEIGSITKTFTALMLARMVEEGSLSLDTPVEHLLPDSVKVPSYKGKKITLQHLVTHTAGLPSVPENMFPAPDRLNPYADYAVEQMYNFLSSYELTEAPGKSHKYSNLEMGLLGHILELQSGMSFEKLLQHFIAEPLAMEDTFVSVPNSKKERFAEPFNYGSPAKHWDIPTLTGAGAIRSTAEDMALYMKAQLGLEESEIGSAIKRTHQPRVDTGNGHIDEIGLGWFYSTKGDTIIWHNGGTGGFQSFAGFNKKNGTAAVILASGKQSVDGMGFKMLDQRFSLPEIDSSITVNAKALDAYTGTYQHSSGIKYYVSREGNQLLVQITGQATNPVFPKSKNRFYYKIVDAEIEFTDKESGQFQTLTLYQNGLEIIAKRQGRKKQPPKSAALQNDSLPGYTGIYQFGPDFEIAVIKEENQLLGRVNNMQKYPLQAQSATIYSLNALQAKVEFINGEDEQFSRMKLYQDGRMVEGRRISDVPEQQTDDQPQEQVQPTTNKAMVELSDTILSKYTGTYVTSDGAKYYVFYRGNQLKVQRAGETSTNVFAKSEHRFFSKSSSVEIEFSDDGTAASQRFTLNKDGREIKAERESLKDVAPKIVPPDPSALSRYIGIYKITPGNYITVRKEGNRLMVQPTNQEATPATYLGKNRFDVESLNAQIEFIPNSSGIFTSIKIYLGGRIIPANRLED